jgi:hypothetical protein
MAAKNFVTCWNVSSIILTKMSPLDLLRSLNQISLQLCLMTFPPLPLDLFPAAGAELFGEELGDVVQGDLFNECSNEGLYKIWQNGLGQQYELDGRRMGSTIETAG